MRLKSFLLLRGLLDTDPRSARQIAKAAGVGQSTLANLAVGRRTTCTPETAAKIADALGVGVDVLFVRRDL